MNGDNSEMLGVILEKFDRLDSRFDKMDNRFDVIDSRLDKMDNRFDVIDSRLDKMDLRFNKVEAGQKDLYRIVRGLEESSKVMRAEQDKMMHILTDIQGKFNKLVDIVADHESVIEQIRAIQ